MNFFKPGTCKRFWFKTLCYDYAVVVVDIVQECSVLI